MACEYRFLSGACLEYEGIVEYLLALGDGPTVARSFVDEFDRQLERICDNPEAFPLSRLPQVAAKGYRVALVKNYALLYFFRDGVVYIAHIFHQRQDYAQLV